MNNLAQILEQHQSDLRRISKTARRLIDSQSPLAAMIGRRHLSGGKQLRAMVALTAGRLCQEKDVVNDKIACAIEIIHSATLLHDDVVDAAPMRRQRLTANRKYGNAAAVLAGDFLYSRASQILAEIGSVDLLVWISNATNSLAEGEILQLENSGKITEEKTYFDIIHRKTANLFEAAAVAVALVKQQHALIPALAEYGKNLGMAFQLIDDCLDYEGNDEQTGKKIGADFAEGKMTLPAIYALKSADVADRKRLLDGWQSNQKESFVDTLKLIRQTGALQKVQSVADEYVKNAMGALSKISDGEPHVKTLISLAHASIHRNY